MPWFVPLIIIAAQTLSPIVYQKVGPTLGWLFTPTYAHKVKFGLVPDPFKEKDAGPGDLWRDLAVTVRSSVEPRRIVYGEIKVSGPLVFADVSDGRKDYLHLIIPIAGHRIEAVGDLYLNDSIAHYDADGNAYFRQHKDGTSDTLGTTDAGPMYKITPHLGDDDQAADAALMAADPKWTSEHRLRGVAYLYVKLRSDPGIWTSGIPNIAAVTRGRKLYDPRATTVSISSSSAANPAVFTTGAAHGLSPLDRIFIDGHGGASTTIAKEYQVATTPSPTTFTLLRNDGAAPVGETLALTVGGAGGTLSKMIWSDNAALCVLDYLLASFGFNCDLSEIDAASFVAAANICDEMVALTETSDSFTADPATDKCNRPTLSVPMRRGDGVQVSSTGALPTGLSAGVTYYYIPQTPSVSIEAPSAGQPTAFNFKLATSRANALAGIAIDIAGASSGVHTVTRKSQVRYDCNGVAALDRAPIDNIQNLLSASAGALSYTQGAFRLMVGAAGTPVVTLDENDLRGELSLRTKTERKDLFNTVRGTFVDPDDYWQARDFPQVTVASFKTADGGEEIARDIELHFTNDATRAQRLAKIALMRARTGGLAVNFPAKLSALRIAPLDTINLSIAKLGLVGADFLVTDWRFSDDLGIDLTLSATAASDYAWSATDAQALQPGAQLTPIDVTFAQAPGLSLSDEVIESSTGGLVTRLVATLAEPSDQFITGYEAEYRKLGETLYAQMGSGARAKFHAVGVEDGETYEVRARAINAAGAYSDYVTGARQVVGLVAVPADVTGFAVNVIGGTAHLGWNPVADVDLSHYRLRHSPVISGASWSSAVDLVPRIGRPATSVHVPALSGAYLIKAVDLGGRESTNAATSISSIADVLGFNAVATVTEHPAFAGAHSGTTVTADPFLTLDRTPSWDSLVGNWDALAGNWDALSPNLYTSGVYSFAGTVDLGAVYTSRVTATLAAQTINYSSTWDTLAGQWDQLGGNWDSLTPAKDVGATLEIRTTNDNPAGAPVWSAWRAFVVGDYTARAFQFRATLTTAVNDAAPGVSALSVTVDMPDRVAAGAGLTLTGGALGVSFAPAFKVTPKIGVTMKDMASGDYIAVLNESATGFDISAFNAAGTRVARNFDYMAKGYGEIAA